MAAATTPQHDDPAIALADLVLQLTEDRELDEAVRYYAPGAVLEFPGGVRYGSVHDLADGARGRYRFVRKVREDFVVATRGAEQVVTCMGTLYGEDLAGNAFEDIRFVDVFRISDGLITHQLVWNDLAALGIVPSTPRHPGDRKDPS